MWCHRARYMSFFFLSSFYVRLGSIAIWVPLLIRCARINSVSCNCLWGLDDFSILLYCDVSLSSRGPRSEICNWGCCKINLIAKVRDHFHNFLGYTKNAQKPISIVEKNKKIIRKVKRIKRIPRNCVEWRNAMFGNCILWSANRLQCSLFVIKWTNRNTCVIK